MQNMARFSATSDFDREYLRNEAKHPKLERHGIENDSSRIQQKNPVERLSTIHKEGHVSLDPRKSIFFGRQYFRT